MFAQVFALLLSSAFVFVGTLQVKADEHVEFYLHNGSIMSLTWENEDGYEYFVVRYEEPRPGLSVKSGDTLLVGGYETEGEVFAETQVFKRGCSPASYEVSGYFDEFGNLILSGKAPIRHGCEVVGYAATANSYLVFTKMPWSPYGH